jgi:hypothetical protein
MNSELLSIQDLSKSLYYKIEECQKAPELFDQYETAEILTEYYTQSKTLIEKLHPESKIRKQLLNECSSLLNFFGFVESYINLNINKEIEISYKGEVRKIIPSSWKNEKLIYATCLKDNHIKCFNIEKIFPF